MCHNHKWGTVCDDGWNSNDAMVVCRQLGYKNYINYLSKAYFGAGTGPIWLDNLYCQGKESSVFACTSNAIGVHNCDHNEDAGVICYSKCLRELHLFNLIYMCVSIYVSKKHIFMC